MNKLFQIQVYDKLYWVWGIEGKEHAGYNDNPNTWWLYYSEEEIPDGITPPIDSDSWVPFQSGMNRLNFEINFKQTTRTKQKWGGTDFRSSTFCTINCNGKRIYEFPTTGGDRGLSFAMAKAQHLIVQMFEHPFDFLNPEKEHGRKIYWYGMPATVRVWRHDTPWEIGIDPCYDEVPQEEWWNEYEKRKSTYIPKKRDDFAEIDKEHDEENRSDGWINWGDALSDQHINWFRN